MSLFGLMGDLDDDPFMGGHVRRMSSLMNSFFRDPFGDMMFGGSGGRNGGMLGIGGPLGGDLLPFTGGRHLQSPAAMMLSGGFPSILDQMGSASNGSHVSAMSTVMTMTQGPDGRPQVYQASQSVRQGPGGVRETKKTVADSRTGVKKMSIGRHVYDRGHIIERGQNIYSGEREENEEFINLEEDEADQFNKEWESKARHVMPGRNSQAAIGYGNSSVSHRRRHHGSGQQLALPSTASQPPQPPQPPQRYVGRSSRRSTYGHSHLQQHQPSTASTIAASIEESDGESEEEPPKKRKKEIIITEVDDDEVQEDDKIVLNDEDEDDDEDEVQEVVDSDNESDSDQVLNNKSKKKI